MTALDRTTDAAGVSWHCDTFEALSCAGLYEVMCLRQQVFVVEQACIYLDADGLDPPCLHLRATAPGGRLVAYARLVPPGARYGHPSIGRVIVAASHRGTGLAQALMRQAIERCRAAYPAPAIQISAQAHLQRFYGRLGFVTQGEPYDEDGISHVDMLLVRPAEETEGSASPQGLSAA